MRKDRQEHTILLEMLGNICRNIDMLGVVLAKLPTGSPLHTELYGQYNALEQLRQQAAQCLLSMDKGGPDAVRITRRVPSARVRAAFQKRPTAFVRYVARKYTASLLDIMPDLNNGKMRGENYSVLRRYARQLHRGGEGLLKYIH